MTEKYSKASLVASKGFKPIERDILERVLDPTKTYSKTEADKKIKDFKGGLR